MKSYSTDKLIEELGTIITEANASEQFGYSKLNKSIADAIIAKLRAGDALCKAAKNLGYLVSVNRYTRCAFSSLTIDEQYEEFKKAIADYEGKK